MSEDPTNLPNQALTIVPSGGPDEAAESIIRSHVIWSMGAGLIPLPLADVAAVTAIQMDALKQLAITYGVDYSEAGGKRFVTALAGGAAARMGASIIKLIPGFGSMIGGVSMSALSGASTYAVCQAAINHFKTHGDFLEIDIEDAKFAYRAALDKGKAFVDSMKSQTDDAKKLHQQIGKLDSLRDDGVLTEMEYEARKAEVLAKIDDATKETDHPEG